MSFPASSEASLDLRGRLKSMNAAQLDWLLA